MAVTHILSVIHGATYGGPCNEIATLASSLVERGFDYTVVLPDEPGSARARLEAQGVRVVQRRVVRFRRRRNPGFWLLFPFRYFRDVIALARLIRKLRVSLVHGYGVNLQVAWAARIAQCPLTWSIVESGVPRPIRVVVRIVVSRLAAAILVDGTFLATEYGLRGPQVQIYYPPVDPARFRPRTARQDDSTLVVGTVANLNRSKGLDVLIAAADIVVGNSEARFTVTGGRHATQEHLARELFQRAELLPAGRFEFLGETSDVGARLRELDVFVISSRQEGTTTTAIEAMATALPVVATRVGGVPEVVEDGVTGLLVQPEDPAALAAAILRLVQDRDLRRQLGEKGYERFKERFGHERFIASVLAAYDATGVAGSHPGDWVAN
jgi:glycosyltransferase involved in cell wall biosynthesis